MEAVNCQNSARLKGMFLGQMVYTDGQTTDCCLHAFSAVSMLFMHFISLSQNHLSGNQYRYLTRARGRMVGRTDGLRDERMLVERMDGQIEF